MTVDMSGLAAAQARVNQIQSLFGNPATPATVPTAGGFGDAMSRAQGQQSSARQPVASTSAKTTAAAVGSAPAKGSTLTTASSQRAGLAPTATATTEQHSRRTTTGITRSSRAEASAPAAAPAVPARRATTAQAPDDTQAVTSTKSLRNADAVIATAKKYLGIPYRWGGTNPRTGLDCSGFVQLVMKQHGVDLPRVSRDQARMGTRVDSLADARPGDLVAFGSPVHHIGIYVGDGKMIHAPHTGDVVKISKVHKNLTAIRRVLPEDAAAAVATQTAAPAQGARAASVKAPSSTGLPAAGIDTVKLASRLRTSAMSAAVGADSATWQQAVAGAVSESLVGAKVDDPQAVLKSALTGLGEGVQTTGAQLAAAQARTAAVAAAAQAATGGATRTPAGSALAPDARGTAALDQAPARLRQIFVDAERKYGVPATLLAAVAKQESNFKPNAVSHAGAQGLMQLMPGTARGLGVRNSFDPEQAVDGAARLLRSHLRTFKSTELALAAYNAGPGAVRKYDGIPPYSETQNYVRRIMAGLKGVAA